MSKHTHQAPDALGRKYTPRQWAPEFTCKYCDEQRDKDNAFFPPHHASTRCESGKREHCTCDICF